jgi:hypothetical protein
MGDICAMHSINRVLEKHELELIDELGEMYPSKLIKEFRITNNIRSIDVTAVLADDTTLPLVGYDIDDLAERFPDCDVGY